MFDDFSTITFTNGAPDFVDADSPDEILARHEDDPPADPLEGLAPAEVLGAMIRGLVGDQPPSPSRALAIGIRVFVMSHLMRPDSVPGARSLAQLAKRLECTRASTSWHARQLEKIVGLHFRPQKCANTVATFADAQRGNRNGATRHRSARPRLDSAKSELKNQNSGNHVRHLTSDN
jgi:hypothetical protein